uniref:Sugar transporter SWEET1 n=1 Tax=Strigamia maritima TaxID=126957 RepID=T1JJG2_STRMM
METTGLNQNTTKFMHKLFLSMIAGLCVIVGYTSFLSNAEHGLWVAGLLSSLVTMFFVAAPLADLRTVIRTQSTACLPLFMILMNLLLGLLFLVYGYLLQDIFIQIPNAIGVTVSVVALSFYVIYPSKPAKKLSYR